MAIVGYAGIIREIEPGWGDRPDGFVLAKSKEDIQKFVRENNCFKAKNSDYCVLDNIVFCELSELAEEDIEASDNNVVWIPHQRQKEYILKH